MDKASRKTSKKRGCEIMTEKNDIGIMERMCRATELSYLNEKPNGERQRKLQIDLWNKYYNEEVFEIKRKQTVEDERNFKNWQADNKAADVTHKIRVSEAKEITPETPKVTREGLKIQKRRINNFNKYDVLDIMYAVRAFGKTTSVNVNQVAYIVSENFDGWTFPIDTKGEGSIDGYFYNCVKHRLDMLEKEGFIEKIARRSLNRAGIDQKLNFFYITKKGRELYNDQENAVDVSFKYSEDIFSMVGFHRWDSPDRYKRSRTTSFLRAFTFIPVVVIVEIIKFLYFKKKVSG